ncbi:uncharacterized protein LTHEOB_9786 [Lasiodiplodia theobromae]|uniref:uncharacterized protein n=1 Tax=Lasiodiplodia theobromae TaxID=45133 RepID=UPI0015C2FA6E|nr:uncharacterized protein LTHEOB_9786 [Lasiodiplodia theobromae]KAF4539974.1 hypothetical protein LTHEOB_9786 [Lasiodiplodia theobromae]
MDLLFSTISTVASFLGTATSHTQNAVRSVKWTELPSDAQRFFSRVAGASTNFVSMRWDDLPQKTKDWIKANPYQTAFYVAHGVVIVAPTPVTAPLIGAAGLASASPAAGSAAAAIQTALTTVGTNSVALRTAVTTGHGAPAIADGLQAAIAIGTGIYGLWTYFAGAPKKEEPVVQQPAGDPKKIKKSKTEPIQHSSEPAASKRGLSSFRGLFKLRRRETAA